MEPFVDLMTEAGEKLLETLRESPSARPWNVYPRPALVRDSFLCLNGTWDFCVTATDAIPGSQPEPAPWRSILVPFAPQSLLSGINENIPDGSYLWYRRRITIPINFLMGESPNDSMAKLWRSGRRLILHIDAADQVTTVFVNGREVGTHRGGYSRASFDITDAMRERHSLQAELLIRVHDRLSDRVFPYGKQSLKRGGMWYTPVSGIWQSVWMESVSARHVEAIHYTVVDNGGAVSVEFDITGIRNGKLTLDAGVPSGSETSGSPEPVTADIIDGSAHVKLADARRWSPDDPYLYYYTIETESDRVRSYFAVRTISVKTDEKAVPRVCLNGRPVFFNGLLDQGYWSDGLLTPPSPDCYGEEISRLKAIGFNTLRKHIKIEPDLFYYECDRSGIFVFQDMVNNGEYRFLRDTALPTIGRLRRDDTRLNPDSATRAEFKRSLIETVTHLRTHPAIVLWTIFNEGWGQFCGTELYRLLRSLDNTRLIDTASGWFAGPETDIESRHVYFRKVRPVPAGGKPFLVTEFGGYSWKPEGHCFNTRSTYGYGSYRSREDLAAAVRALYEEQILPLIPGGLCGTVYTQVSDVEDETNGVFSYDRRVQKLLPEDIRDVFDRLL